ncbi:MAG TPA: PEP-CTERM sorting domain-containing protein, partial [Longimicrobiaceae bacterium]|nr:PEP-CTERM sorting domain-containing protein [Longimicrobiaceae bacterium]
HFVRLTARLGLSGLALLIYSAPAAAQDYEGYTNGCFYEDGESICSPASTSPPGTATIENWWGGAVLNFEGTSFFGAAVAGPTTLNLGKFSLGNFFIHENFKEYNFRLRTTFLRPTSAEGLFTASLNGTIWLSTYGSINIDFDDNTFVFPDNRYKLTVNNFTLYGDGHIHDLFCGHPASANLTGTITNTSVTPEPVSMVLLGSGLAGLGAARRRRKNAVDSDA